MENLIGPFQELERQQIYFASRNQLNDPLEGTLRFFWKGDKIVWENLLKHYLLCLEHVVLLARLKGENENITEEDIPIFKSENDLPTKIYKERIQKITNLFFADKFVQSYLKFILNNPYKIYKEEMFVHLKILNRIALKSIFAVDYESGLSIELSAFSSLDNIRNSNFDIENFWLSFKEEKDAYSAFIEAIHGFIKNVDTELLLKLKDSPKSQVVYVEFPELYLNAIQKLTYPESYVACFMDNCTNSSVWGSYGVNHTGVCLKFKAADASSPLSKLSLKTITGYSSSSGPFRNFVDFPLKPIIYTNSFDEIDFFRNIGRLTIRQIKEQWYTNDENEFSNCSEDMLKNEAKWREQYWKNYEPAYFKKIPSWSHEREYRIAINSVLDSYEDSSNRLLEYRFEDLEAIIFGMRTPKESRTKIIEIVKRKCEELGRNNFDFFEMVYSNTNGELVPRKILSLDTK